MVTIGGGKQAPSEIKNHVLEVAKVAPAYGDTQIFVHDAEYRKRLSQWPVAVALSEIYAIEGEPDAEHDLDFDGGELLFNAFDGVIRKDALIEKLWKGLSGYEVTQKNDLFPIPGFVVPEKVIHIRKPYAAPLSSSEEGRKYWSLSLKAERDPALKKEAKLANRTKNSGLLVCEACGFGDQLSGMFDAHHINPVAAGERKSTSADLIVLCPTCHRWSHAKASNKLEPIPLEVLREVRRSK
jgi:hypothetical protein